MNNKEENDKRIKQLYNKHYDSILIYTNKLTKNEMESEELIQNMFLSLIQSENDKLYYADSFNLVYIQKIIYSRFINQQKNELKNNQNIEFDELINEDTTEEYDYVEDSMFTQKYNITIDVIKEFKQKRINKYVNVYLKYRLNKITIKTAATTHRVTLNTIYTNFNNLDKMVKEEVEKRIENIELINSDK